MKKPEKKDSEAPSGEGKKPKDRSIGSFIPKLRKERSLDDFLEGISKGDRIVLGQAITLIESTRQDHQELARQLVEACLPNSGQSFRIGITGTPGVGKSTFIETMGQQVLQEGKKLAILAIDPSSHRTRGSILGDKTRMEVLSAHEDVFIRPSPAGTSLGGVARKTRETILLCEAAGYDTIFIETVGVGQSEIAVHSMVDFFLLLLLPGAGDELQGIKRGIVEMADLIAVNKADGDRVQLAKKARQAYRNALHLFPPGTKGWTPKAMTCSALENIGIAEIWKEITLYHQTTLENHFFTKNRRQQAAYWYDESIDLLLRQHFFQNPKVKAHWENLRQQVIDGKLSSFGAAQRLLDKSRD